MAAPYLNDWSPTAKVAAHTALVTALAGGAVAIYDSADTLLVTVALDSPVGTVDAGTGALTLVPDSAGTAIAAGTAAYATLLDADDAPWQSLPCESGSSAVSGKCILNTLTIVDGKAFELISWVID